MMNWWLKLTTFVWFVRSSVAIKSACQCPRVYQAKLSHCTLNPVYHRGRPAHWHWTLSHLKEGRGTALRLSSDTKQDRHKKRKSPKTKKRTNSNPDSSLSIDNWLLINWTWGCDWEETCKSSSEIWVIQQDKSTENPATRLHSHYHY